MIEAWRIVKKKRASGAFSGEGAAIVGGRWNSRGVRMVYTSSSKSLAALESLVHLNPPVQFKYVAIRITFASALVEKLSVNDLPSGWRRSPVPRSIQRIGDLWVKEARSAVLEVPSVIIPTESNYLLNPLHPGMAKISIDSPESFTFDPRLLE